MLKLFYSPGSCATASHIALEEAGADYELEVVKLGEQQQRTPEYLALNPKGRVPALATDRGVLTENPAILAYVAQTWPKAGLMPLNDPFAFAEIQALNMFLCATLHPTFAHKFRPGRYADDAQSQAAMQAKAPSVLDEQFGLAQATCRGQRLIDLAKGGQQSQCDDHQRDHYLDQRETGLPTMVSHHRGQSPWCRRSRPPACNSAARHDHEYAPQRRR